MAKEAGYVEQDGESAERLSEEKSDVYGEQGDREEEGDEWGGISHISEANRKRRNRELPPKGIYWDAKEDKESIHISLQKDILAAKARLQREEFEPHRINLFDHFSAVIYKFIKEKPKGGDSFEEFSKKIKRTRFIPATDHLKNAYIPPQFTESETILRLLKTVQDVDIYRKSAARDGARQAHLVELLSYFEQVGVGLPTLEIFCIRIKLQNMIKMYPLKSYRFWGKIMGIYDDYIIAETEEFLSDIERRQMEQDVKEEEKREEEKRLLLEEQRRRRREQQEQYERVTAPFVGWSAASPAAARAKQATSPAAGRPPRASWPTSSSSTSSSSSSRPREEKFPPMKPPLFPPLPPSTFQKPPEVPPERRGQGVNRKVYYVTKATEEEWVELPDVTPKQIQVARKIRKFFTGDLNTEMRTYPPFPGKEMHYLRAQIARISASTHVSPKGFYRIERAFEEAEEEEEEEEEEELKKTQKNRHVEENPFYQPESLEKLLKVNYWVHHTTALLEQGRTTFWVPPKDKVVMKNEEEEEGTDENERTGRQNVEVSPPLFRSLDKDKSSAVHRLWAAQASSSLLPETAITVLRSELWPGACAFSSGRKFENIYVGWGLKFSSCNFRIPMVPPISSEYITGPEIMEIYDPTWEQEELWRIAHEPKPRPMRKEEEVLVEEEESEEEDAESETDEKEEEED